MDSLCLAPFVVVGIVLGFVGLLQSLDHYARYSNSQTKEPHLSYPRWAMRQIGVILHREFSIRGW